MTSYCVPGSNGHLDTVQDLQCLSCVNDDMLLHHRQIMTYCIVLSTVTLDSIQLSLVLAVCVFQASERRGYAKAHGWRTVLNKSKDRHSNLIRRKCLDA